MQKSLLFLLFLACFNECLAQPIFIRIKKVDIANEQVTLKCYSSITIDVEEFGLCINGDINVVGDLPIVYGSYQIPSNDSLIVSIALPDSGDLGLYDRDVCHHYSFLDHYVQWGNMGYHSEGFADQASMWEAGDFLTTSTHYDYTPPGGGYAINGASDWQMLTDLPEAINRSEQLMQIYPNPASDFFKIDLPFWVGQGKMLQVFNALGVLIYQQNTAAEQLTIDTKSWPVGVYYISVTAGRDKLSKRLLLN